MNLEKVFNKESNQYIYKCSCCNKIYENRSLCFGADVPSSFFSIPENERDARIQLDKSWCVIDDKYFFHRGRLAIPIIDHGEQLIFDAWTSISEDNFCNRMDFWEDPFRVNEGPYFGWLNTNIPTYDNTINLKTIAIEQEVGCIPDIMVTEENHPLKLDQKKGISMDKTLDIVHKILHEY
jgi:hypothetical protein